MSNNINNINNSDNNSQSSFHKILNDWDYLNLFEGEMWILSTTLYILSNLLESSDVISSHTKNLIRRFLFSQILDINLLSEIVGELYTQYLKIRQDIIK